MDLCRRLLCIMRGYNPGRHLSSTNSSTSSSTPAATTQHGQRWPSSPPLRFVGGLDMASVAGFISQLDEVIGFDTELSRTMTSSPTRRIFWRTRWLIPALHQCMRKGIYAPVVLLQCWPHVVHV